MSSLPGPPAVLASGLVRRFGPVPALDGVDLEVAPGTFNALFGPNGAGKTTLLRVLATLTRPDAGHAALAGVDVADDPDAARRLVGLVAHRTLLYPDLTAEENLRFYARLYGVPHDPERLRERLAAVGLARYRHERVRTFSRGTAQRLAIARAVLHDPPVLLLDEPHTGLDPSGADALDETLVGLVRRGRTVLMTTHDLGRGYMLADRLAILCRGRVVWAGRRDDVSADAFAALYRARTAPEVQASAPERSS